MLPSGLVRCFSVPHEIDLNVSECGYTEITYGVDKRCSSHDYCIFLVADIMTWISMLPASKSGSCGLI